MDVNQIMCLGEEYVFIPCREIRSCLREQILYDCKDYLSTLAHKIKV
jgi:hypothetical protein